VADTGSIVHNEDAAVAGLGFGLYMDILEDRLLNTDVAVSARAGLAGRFVQGNLGNNARARTVALNGNEKTSFGGVELGLALQVGAVGAGVQYYKIGKGSGDVTVPSLTGGQWVIGLSVAGNIVSGPGSKD
jgi:hypothetical protein